MCFEPLECLDSLMTAFTVSRSWYGESQVSFQIDCEFEKPYKLYVSLVRLLEDSVAFCYMVCSSEPMLRNINPARPQTR